jgi:hypothetical protein
MHGFEKNRRKRFWDGTIDLAVTSYQHSHIESQVSPVDSGATGGDVMENQRSSVYLCGVLGILVVLALLAKLNSSNDPESNWLQDVLPSNDSTTSIEFNRRSDSTRQQSSLRIRDQRLAQLNNQIDRKIEELRVVMLELSKKTFKTTP